MQSNTNVRHNLTPRERNEVFQAHIDDLSPEHRDLHNNIIKTTNKQLEGRMKTLEGNLTELSQAKKYHLKRETLKRQRINY